ncbi:hypothetical protein [Nesterenkonia sp.]|uniref:hypothetical protein n=1 Tax=Nesterenkonia sp. TaxID=704201 RepID=UPI002634ABBC|nr:hypothetical protein [Nesterenkonia sp.]
MPGGVLLLVVGLSLAPAGLLFQLMASQVRGGAMDTVSHVWGLRTKKLQSSDEAWRVGHRAALGHLQAMAWWTWGAVAACLLGALVIRSEELAGYVLMLVVGGFTVAVLGHTWRAVVTAHRAVDDRLELAQQLLGEPRS